MSTIYLYLKQHAATGLLYFGKTTTSDPYKYLGSGSYWRHHIAAHGKEHVRTIKVWTFDNLDKCSKFAKLYSIENNIVESSTYANLAIENGLDGVPAGIAKTEAHRQKISESNKKPKSEQTKQRMSEAPKGIPRTAETIAKIKANHKGMRGRKHSEDTKRKISEANARRRQLYSA